MCQISRVSSVRKVRNSFPVKTQKKIFCKFFNQLCIGHQLSFATFRAISKFCLHTNLCQFISLSLKTFGFFFLCTFSATSILMCSVSSRNIYFFKSLKEKLDESCGILAETDIFKSAEIVPSHNHSWKARPVMLDNFSYKEGDSISIEKKQNELFLTPVWYLTHVYVSHVHK